MTSDSASGYESSALRDCRLHIERVLSLRYWNPRLDLSLPFVASTEEIRAVHRTGYGKQPAGTILIFLHLRDMKTDGRSRHELVRLPAMARVFGETHSLTIEKYLANSLTSILFPSYFLVLDTTSGL